MKYEKPQVEVVKFDSEGFMTASGASTTGWSADQGVNNNNVYDFLATKGVSPSDIQGGGVDALQIVPSARVVICSRYTKQPGAQFSW